MFEQVLQLVKQHVGNNPQVSEHIPREQKEAVNQEIAHGVADGLKSNLTEGGIGGMLSSLTGSGSSPGNISSTIQKAVADRLTGKFGLSDGAIRSITAAIPGIIQKITNKS
jgi:uncharacterized protein YidB (DUF937 family)